MMLALEMFRSLPRYVAARAARRAACPGCCPVRWRRCGWSPSTSPTVGTAGLGPVRTRLSGICGSDLGALIGPHLPVLLRAGVDAVRSRPRGGRRAARRLRRTCPAGTRVVLDPVLSCAARGRRAVRPSCAPGAPTGATGSPSGTSRPGCRPASARTPAAAGASSWSAHRSQLHAVPGRPDRRAGRARRAAGLRGAHRAARRGRPRRPRARLRAPARSGLFATLALRELTAGRADHRRRQARPPARPGAGLRGHRGGRAGGGAARRPPRDPAPSSSSRSCGRAVPARRRRRRHRRGRQQAVAGDRAARDPGRRPGGAVRDAAPAPTCRAAWFRELEVVGIYASSPRAGRRRPRRLRHRDRAGRPTPALDCAGRVASYPLHRLARGARPRPLRPAGSVRSRLRSTRGAVR